MSLRKIAYLTGEYPRASDTFIQREVAALRGLGHEVQTCSIRRTGVEHLVGPEQRSEQAQTFHVLEAVKSTLFLRALGQNMRQPARFLSALKLAWSTAPKGIKGRLYQMIYLAEAMVLATKLQDAGVTHLHNHIAKASCTVAMLASHLSGIPYSFTIHGPDIFFEPHHWRIDEKAARAKFVACISNFARSQLMCFAKPADWDRFHIVHCGIQPDRYTPTEVAEPHLLFVGRLAGVKGVPILLQSVADLATDIPDLRLTLIGDGPDRAELETKARDLGIADRCDFVGYKSQSEVAEALTKASVFVLPSFAEGVPVVLMEAMAAGVPVLTTRIAGIPELVEDGVSGKLVAPGDTDALTGALKDLLSPSTDRRAMGQAGRDKVTQDFNIATEAAKLSALFQGDLHERG